MYSQFDFGRELHRATLHFPGWLSAFILNGLIKFGSCYFIGMEGGNSLSSSKHLSILWVEEFESANDVMFCLEFCELAGLCKSYAWYFLHHTWIQAISVTLLSVEAG